MTNSFVEDKKHVFKEALSLLMYLESLRFYIVQLQDQSKVFGALYFFDP